MNMQYEKYRLYDYVDEKKIEKWGFVITTPYGEFIWDIRDPVKKTWEVKVPKEKVKLFIGANGAQIKQLEKDCYAKINVIAI
jgi:ribosomal protein S3